MNPPRSFKFRFKINGICRMSAHCVRARFRDRSRPCFTACARNVHATFKHLIVAERARPCGSGPGELLTALACHGLGAVSAGVISVQNGEHSFCSKRRYDEEKSFNGHSFLASKRGTFSAEPSFFLVAWHTGKESVKGTLLP